MSKKTDLIRQKKDLNGTVQRFNKLAKDFSTLKSVIVYFIPSMEENMRSLAEQIALNQCKIKAEIKQLNNKKEDEK